MSNKIKEGMQLMTSSIKFSWARDNVMYMAGYDRPSPNFLYIIGEHNYNIS
jgi:hypothetical protein